MLEEDEDWMVSKSEMESLAARVVAAAAWHLLRDTSYSPELGLDRAQEAYLWMERRLNIEPVTRITFNEFRNDPKSKAARSALEAIIVEFLKDNKQDIYFLQHLSPDPGRDYDIGEVISKVGSALSGANTKVGAFGKN
jgi:hypothetical protein